MRGAGEALAGGPAAVFTACLLAACVLAGTVLVCCIALGAPAALAQSSPPDAMAKAYLFGAAFRDSDLSPKPGGMMFLPGRGLIRWETRGKSLAEQDELRTEAIGRADARAVQAELDAAAAAIDRLHGGGGERLAAHDSIDLASAPSASGPPPLAAVAGTRRLAGGVVPLNRAARAASAVVPGVRSGASYGARGRLYMFGAVSGQAVGLNLMHEGVGGWKSGGLSTDNGGFVGQRQAGLALREGPAQAALSFVQEKTHAQLFGMSSIKDRRAMLNFSFTPGAKP